VDEKAITIDTSLFSIERFKKGGLILESMTAFKE
jgi:hypothetical protein